MEENGKFVKFLYNDREAVVEEKEDVTDVPKIMSIINRSDRQERVQKSYIMNNILRKKAVNIRDFRIG